MLLMKERAKEYIYKPIEYQDSWISIDPIIGCQMSCGYCFMQITNWTNVKPECLYSVSEIVELLLKHKYFTPNETVLSFGNQTDAFLPINCKYTLNFLDTMEQKGLTNPIIIITKKKIPASILNKVSEYQHIKVIFILSYSGLSPDLEKGVLASENKENFKEIKERGLRLIHFWRPIILQNGSLEIFTKILEYVSKYSMASVYAGLRKGTYLRALYDKNPRLNLSDKIIDTCGYYIPEDIENRLKALVTKRCPEYPLFRHTSCAVSYVLSIPDYNGTLYQDSICKESNCPSLQRSLCKNAATIPEKQKVKELLAKLGMNSPYKINNNHIEISGEIDQEGYTFLLHKLNFPIKVTINKSRNLWGSIFQYERKTGQE